MEKNMENTEEVIATTRDETDKKCPQCGGVMDFNPASGQLKCPYCEYEEVIPVNQEEPKKAEELDFSKAEFSANKNWGAEKKTIICEACGAQSIYDALQTAAVCPFCGSNQVMEQNASDTIAPGGVVPFSITDKQAADLFRTWIKGKWFCPKLAKESAKPKKFNGIYLPYWTFDTQTHSSYIGEYGIDHTYHDKDGDTHVETDWHRTSGTYDTLIDDELVLASTTHDMGMLRQLEPFDTENNKVYKPEYIAGFVAERYSIGLKDAWKTAKQSIREKLRNSISNKIRGQHHADHVRGLHVDTDFSEITYKYLLLPIWVSNFKYKDKVYQFMVNGQTGKIAGKTPLSIPKIIITVLAVIAVIVLLHYVGIF